MSIHADRVRSLHDDIARLQERVAREAENEARASDRIVRATESLARASSVTSAQSYQREIQSQQRQLARHTSDRARLSTELARKQKDLAYHQKEMMREQQREAQTTSALIRRLQDENRARQNAALSSVAPALASSRPDLEHDAFISHASEDKDELARPLAQALSALGRRVWYDEFALKVGDSLRRSIDRGLANSRFGIVVLSPSFFEKNWPQYELDGLVAKEQEGKKVILPLWHRVSKNDVLRYSPTLADRVALSTAMFTVEETCPEAERSPWRRPSRSRTSGWWRRGTRATTVTLGTGQSEHLEPPGTSCEASERRLAVLAGTASATRTSADYTPVILSPIHWSQRPVSPTLGSLPLIAASWTGILLARPLAIIDRHWGLFSPEQGSGAFDP